MYIYSSVRRASKRKSEGRGFEPHVRLTLSRIQENLSTTLNIIYIYIYMYIYIYIYIYPR